MKKRNSYSRESKLIEKIFFLGVLVIVFIVTIFLSLNSTNILLGPDESSMSYENAQASLSKLSPEGIAWYCGKKDNYVDSQGNVYGARALQELKRILGNEIKLRNDFCIE